ncbi:MAG: baseplate J/gp47 family protein, partial [Oscillospiraceae bacterium]|nr:baseplate J/gp47 family protein [Oscillospiraceae bacterium]
KPGADIELSFHLSFEDFPIEGYPEVQIRLKKLMKAAELEPPPDYVIDIAEIAWEYYNGTGWALLNAGEPEMFSDSPAKRCTVRFTCPGDMSPTVWGAHEAPFIRARVLAVNNLFRMTGHYRAPVITGLRLRYAGQFPLCSAEVFEHRERRTVTFPAALRGALPEPEAVYFAWSEAFCEGTVFFDIDGRRPSPLRWEYAVPGGWERLGVHDGTDGLTKSGILAYRTSGPCAKTRLFGHEGYWMRVCPEGGAFEGGLRPVARLLGIAENAVPASARFPGTEANLPPGAFRSLLTPLAGISAVSNPTRCAGGAAEEEERHVIRRLTAGLCHNGRAVSAADCEALALEASPLVLRARYFCNAGEDGTFEPGRDCLAVSCEGDFEAVRRDVLSYVGARRPLGAGKLSVVPLTGVLDAQAV